MLTGTQKQRQLGPILILLIRGARTPACRLDTYVETLLRRAFQAKGMAQLLLAQQDFCGFNNYSGRITGLQLHLLRASTRDDALDLIVTHLNDNVGHLTFPSFTSTIVPRS